MTRRTLAIVISLNILLIIACRFLKDRMWLSLIKLTVFAFRLIESKQSGKKMVMVQ